MVMVMPTRSEFFISVCVCVCACYWTQTLSILTSDPTGVTINHFQRISYLLTLWEVIFSTASAYTPDGSSSGRMLENMHFSLLFSMKPVDLNFSGNNER